MSTGKYYVSVNGFRCNRQSWDDAFNWDGKADEVFIAVGYKIVNKTGTILESRNPEATLVMGDTWNQPNRIQAGSASNRGGIITGDAYPTMAPWVRSRPLDDTMDWPPYTIWEGTLTQGEDVVFITPTIWEWDPGTSFWDTLLAWHVAIDAQFGQRAKDVFAGRWPMTGWFFDAISLGLQTAGTLQGIWGGLGRSGNRPIGIQRDPNNHSSNEQVKLADYFADPAAQKLIWYYPVYPTAAAHEAMKLIGEAKRALSKVAAPLLVIYCRGAATIHPQSAQLVDDGVRATDKAIIALQASSQVITIDREWQQMLEETYRFVQVRS